MAKKKPVEDKKITVLTPDEERDLLVLAREKVRITASGDSDYGVGEIVDQHQVEKISKTLVEAGKTPPQLIKVRQNKREQAKAIRKLIACNQYLVEYISRSYSFTTAGFDHKYLEAVSTISLKKAIEMFNLNTFFAKNQLISQNPLAKEKKNVVYYDDYHQKDEDNKSYALIDRLNDSDGLESDNREIHNRDLRVKINNLINSSLTREQILITRLYYKIRPRDLTDIYYLADEEEKKKLKSEWKLEQEDLPSLALSERECQNSEIVKKYLAWFNRKYTIEELSKLVNKPASLVNKLKKSAFQHLQEELKKEENKKSFHARNRYKFINYNMEQIVVKSSPVAISPQKMKLVAGLLRRKNLDYSLQALPFFPKKGGRIVYKLLQGIAKSLEKQQQKTNDFFLTKIEVNPGRIQKKILCRAKGRTDRIRRRYCLVNFNLKIKEIISENNPHSSTFVFQYLPPTLGLTVGNFLRRVLLTSLSGVAAFGIEINHKDGPVIAKFSTLSGIIETTPYLISHCKEIIAEIKESKDGIYCLEMDVNNLKDEERIITAKDFQPNPHLEIKNPDLYLATLAPSSHLQIKLYFREDYGYHSAEKQEKYLPDVKNVLFFATDYSPIKSDGVNFQFHSVVTGPDREEEELKLTIATTGAISPHQALIQALEISNHINDKIKNYLRQICEKYRCPLANINQIYFTSTPGGQTGLRVSLAFLATLQVLNPQIKIYHINALLLQAGNERCLSLLTIDRQARKYHSAVYQEQKNLAPSSLINKEQLDELAQQFPHFSIFQDFTGIDLLTRFQQLKDSFLSAEKIADVKIA
ncbi:13769_t:CDS:2 [Gigaspora margarita]|uniref:13769_t:CDS:1 n=1 Tax=Gigaspora margarita TaxID=4874 RepID=A0ABM8VZU8_GIGMA|nr:13769_t:CDS:2 [Gigaspora margarita]